MTGGRTGREVSKPSDKKIAQTGGRDVADRANGTFPSTRSARTRRVRALQAIRTHSEPIHDSGEALGYAAATVCGEIYGGLVATAAP